MSKLKLKVGQLLVREGGEQPLSWASTREGTCLLVGVGSLLAAPCNSMTLDLAINTAS